MSVPDQQTEFFYTANGVTTTFAYGFYLLQLADIRVSLNGVVQTTGFTVTGVGAQTGGTVVFTTAPANGVSVLIEREVAVKRDSDFQPNGDLRSDVLNNEFDRLWMVHQDRRSENVRSLRYPNAENLDGVLPASASRANMILGFSATGIHTMIPLPASIGAGDIVPQTFTAGVDFTAGVTTQLTLSRAPGTAGNLEVFFDGVFQGFDQWSVAGTTVTFTSAIPVGVSKVFARIGTTLSTQIPPDGSVTDAKIASGSKLANRVNDFLDVKDFGARGDWNGTNGTDDTVAIQATINAAAGGRIYLPAGRYRITAALVINSATTTLEGAGMQATEIVNTTNNTGILRFTGQWGGFRQLSMSYSGTPVSGATAVYSTSANLIGEAFHIKSCYRGLDVTTGPAQLFENFFIDNYVETGIFVHEENDCYFSNFILDAKNTTNGAFGGIRLFNKAEAILFVNASVLNGKFPITTDADVYAQGVRPAYCKFVNCFFDSGSQESNLDKIVESSFTNVWFSGGRTGVGFPGVKLLQTDSISFNGGCNFFNCGRHGLHISSASSRTTVDTCFAESNSITAGASVAHGIYVEPGTSDFILKGNVCRNGLYLGGQQGYGIFIDTGASARYLVKDNNLGGNATGPMFDGGTGALSRVADNIGYNPVGLSAITVGASPFVYFSGNTRETVYITGGTVTAVQSGATVLMTGSEKAIAMEPGESITVLYSSAPTMQRFKH